VRLLKRLPKVPMEDESDSELVRGFFWISSLSGRISAGDYLRETSYPIRRVCFAGLFVVVCGLA